MQFVEMGKEISAALAAWNGGSSNTTKQRVCAPENRENEGKEIREITHFPSVNISIKVSVDLKN